MPKSVNEHKVTMVPDHHPHVGQFAVIGGPPEHRDYWSKVYAGVTIGRNVRISNLVTIDCGTTHDTIIEDDVVLLAHSHVGHDAHIGKGVTISCGAKIGGHAIIGQNSNIGLNAVIHQYVEVPEGCMIGMGCVVTKSTVLEAFGVYVGNPARFLRRNTKAETRVQETKA